MKLPMGTMVELRSLFHRFFGNRSLGEQSAITSQNQDEIQAQRDAERLQLFADMAPAGLTIKSTDGRYIRLSEHALQSYGLGPTGMDATAEDCFETDIVKIIREQDSDVLRTTDVVKREISGEVDGEKRSFLITKFPIFGEPGRPVGIAALSLDIGEDSAAHRKLLASERRMSGMFDNAPIPLLEEDWSALKIRTDDLISNGISDIDKYLEQNIDVRNQLYDACRSTMVSDNIVKLYGANNKEEFLNLLKHENADTDELEGFARALSAFVNGYSSYTYEAEETTFDGRRITTRIKFSIPADRLKDWKQVIVSVEDITIEREIEERLRNSQRMETIGRLAAGVSHDFNNLLAVVQGALDVERYKNNNHFESMQNIQAAVDRGSELTRHLLNYSRSEASFERQECSLDDILADLLQLIEQAVGQAITVRMNLNSKGFVALTDPGFAKDAMLNIALNARDAMPQGGDLHIEADVIERPDEQTNTAGAPDAILNLSFTDTGQGMDEETLANASKPFFTTKVIGTGIGLSSVREFVERSGGSLNIKSTPSVGTTVLLSFPVWRGKVEQSVSPARTLDDANNSALTILLVEDSPIYQDIITEQLEFLGHKAITASDGAQGFDLFEKHKDIDLIVSDIVLPNSYSGLNLVRDIFEKHGHQKVIFITGYSPETDEDIILNYPGSKLLHKPFKLEYLSEAIDDLLDCNRHSIQ